MRGVVELIQQTSEVVTALALMPLPTEKRNAGQRDVPVQRQGVWVRPGDWLLADADGVVVMAHPPGVTHHRGRR